MTCSLLTVIPVLDRIALIANLVKAIVFGLATSVVCLLPRRFATMAWLFLAIALASCVIIATR
jgi:hypothetical protein